ncbi:hypothetical protein ABIB58_003230 [Brevundimonas sp. UYEF29]
MRTQGAVRPGPLGGDRRSGRIEGHSNLIRGLTEIQKALAEQGLATCLSSLWRFFVRRGITL